ncbi:MAG: HIT family protein, partial [Cycloclasticus sp.]
VSTLYELSDEAALACIKTVKRVGKAVQQAMNINGSTVFQHNGKDAGQTVPHFHIHILPGSLFGIKGHAAEFADPDELKITAEKIIACL